MSWLKITDIKTGKILEDSRVALPGDEGLSEKNECYFDGLRSLKAKTTDKKVASILGRIYEIAADGLYRENLYREFAPRSYLIEKLLEEEKR